MTPLFPQERAFCRLKGTRTGPAALESVMIRRPIEGGRAGIVPNNFVFVCGHNVS
jgi:hypothetical protein